MITKVHLSRYMMDLPCIKIFTKSQWKTLSVKQKRKYIDFSNLKNY